MTIPTTPASTANCDQSTDRIADARADIKQNIDNVNEIITHLNTGQWTNQQYILKTTITGVDSAGDIDWDLSGNQVAEVTLSANSTLNNPTNKKSGATYVLIVKQPAGANYTLEFNSDYKFAFGVKPTITASNGAVDILTFISDGTSMFGGIQQDFS